VRRRARTFTTTGRLTPPSGVAAGEACGSGIVSVQVKAGRRTVSTRRTGLRRDCTFRATVTFRRPRRTLTFTARFFGNRVVTGLRTARVRAG
jgi:hypothetical protein